MSDLRKDCGDLLTALDRLGALDGLEGRLRSPVGNELAAAFLRELRRREREVEKYTEQLEKYLGLPSEGIEGFSDEEVARFDALADEPEDEPEDD